MKGLLHKTSNSYILFSFIVLLISAPLFYFIVEHLNTEDADESLILRKKEFLHYSLHDLKSVDIQLWNKINSNAKIEAPILGLTKDTIFYTFFYDSLANENEPYRVLKAPITIENKPYVFSARVNLVETEDLIKSIAGLFIIMIFLLLAGLYFITKRLSLKLWQPFHATLHQMEQFEIDKNIKPELVETNIDEFNRLNLSIMKLILKNSDIYNSQREFIENASHELQTPLAIFNAKLEALIQHPDITSGQAELLTKLTEAASRLNRLNKNLLLLSKIDNSQYPETEDISLKDIIEKHFDFFIEQAEDKNIHIKVQVDDTFHIQANGTLVEILISNLFLNAIRHNVPNGEILVLLEHNKLIISNTGNAQPLIAEKLFQRFSKFNQSDKGSGLGLAIVKKIADLYHWTFTYSFQENSHVFTIQF